MPEVELQNMARQLLFNKDSRCFSLSVTAGGIYVFLLLEQINLEKVCLLCKELQVYACSEMLVGESGTQDLCLARR